MEREITLSKLNDVQQLAKELNREDTFIPEIEIKRESLKSITPFLKRKSFKRVVLIADDQTFNVAGEQLLGFIKEEDIDITSVILKPNRHGQVNADEVSVVQVFSEIPNNTDVLVAVGSGTIHDIVRFVGYKMNIPFVSVPTAASVDGFTSKGAPLIFRGVKETVQTSSPIAVFADVDILVNAPKEMTAAGFGDILGKYTSLLDWKISDLVGGEPYNQLAASMTRKSLTSCVENAEKIASADEEGITILMNALIESGIVMLLLDFSRPASGAEHHLSHYWEMDLLEKDEKQLLHGAKVGVSTTIITELYKKMATELDGAHFDLPERYKEAFLNNWSEIKALIDELPHQDVLKNMLKSVGGPSSTKELGISDEIVQASLNEAFLLRDRCTGLLLLNQIKRESVTYPISKLPL